MTPREVSPADYADALERLHAGMRRLDVRTPHLTDRVEAAQHLVENKNLTRELAGADPARELLSALREGAPWPALDLVMRQPDSP